MTIEHVLTCIEEVYAHSLQKSLAKVDQEFVETADRVDLSDENLPLVAIHAAKT